MRVERVLWDVLAICDHRGDNVWAWLQGQGSDRHVKKMRARMQGSLPRNGPPQNRYHGTALRDKILELKTGPRKGPKLRVLYFFDEGRRIVCTHGFWKDSGTADREIDRAVRDREMYMEAKASGQLAIVEASG